MRHQHVIAVAAGLVHAEEARLQAELLLAAPADHALAAADPGMHQAAVAGLDALGLGPGGHHLADDLVAHGEGRHHAAVLDQQLLAAAHVVLAFPDMDVAVADAGGERAHQHLGALGPRRRLLDFLQGGAKLDDIVALHGADSPSILL